MSDERAKRAAFRFAPAVRVERLVGRVVQLDPLVQLLCLKLYSVKNYFLLLFVHLLLIIRFLFLLLRFKTIELCE